MSLIKRVLLFAALGSAALVAGCASKAPPVAGFQAHPATPLDQYAITTHETPDQVGLAVHGDGISAAQREALAALVARWRQAGGGALTVQTPNDAPDPGGAHAFADAAVSTLGVLGVPYENIRIIGYASGGQAKSVVLAGFNRIVAEAPDCRNVPWENLTATKDNKPYARFGCAMTANLAAQIAYPDDLLGRAPYAPSDAGRRAAVLAKYRDGKVTSTDKDENASGAVSQAIK